MSGSKSSQASTTTNTTVNNVLDGGAIQASFDFATNIADEGFDSVNDAVKTAGETTKHALDSNVTVTKEAFENYEDITETALDNSLLLSQDALTKLTESNNKSLDTLANIQSNQNSSNAALLKGIQSTVKSNNTGGASDVLETQKVALYVIGAMMLIIALMAMRRGK
ncbi:hypothetical protein L1D13_10820 [Vibrio tubiashii]|uniref:hypothetical protein n=1 Tax=Vibrio tubiashii TaxID=29498 RepID=UPI001EFEDA74|nr:hypothetical protein [Vibrio tubiashii]MCG9584622.1 hypothetical protein [Vibrio tubiashii]MCG9618150.1 hypothetical protein [Vibrio tubiashii]MCG9687415.1 hypothetical protein [Vibrio tubiashii]